jgi:hypothetical protein
MSIGELKIEVSKLSDQERKELAVYLAELAELFTPEVVKELSAKIDDKNPARWVSLEEIENRWAE